MDSAITLIKRCTEKENGIKGIGEMVKININRSRNMWIDHIFHDISIIRRKFCL